MEKRSRARAGARADFERRRSAFHAPSACNTEVPSARLATTLGAIDSARWRRLCVRARPTQMQAPAD